MSSTVNYTGYAAQPAPNARPAWQRLLRRAGRFVKVDLCCNTLLYPYGVWRHAQLLRDSPRSQRHTYTCFLRSPLQMQAVTGPVLKALGQGGQPPTSLRVLVFACSNGAEAYTLASALLQAHPDLNFRIEASDLHQEMIDKAIAGRYTRDEVLHSPAITAAFIEHTFDVDAHGYVVKPALRERVHFRQADLLSPALPQQFEAADIVVAQNVLFHLPPAAATQAFHSLVQLMRPRAALLIEGTDLPLKRQLTREHLLTPLRWGCRAIYEHSRAHVSAQWWRFYWGSEPYAQWRRDKLRRYSSIFFRA